MDKKVIRKKYTGLFVCLLVFLYITGCGEKNSGGTEDVYISELTTIHTESADDSVKKSETESETVNPGTGYKREKKKYVFKNPDTIKSVSIDCLESAEKISSAIAARQQEEESKRTAWQEEENKQQVAENGTDIPEGEEDNSPATEQTDNYVGNNGVSLNVLGAVVSEDIKARGRQITDMIISPGMSELEKVLIIHDYIIDNTVYPMEIPSGNNRIFHSVGVFDDGIAVCQGYAEAFCVLCYSAGIQAEMVIGTAYNGYETSSHAWNIVRIDGNWYQIDVTWDDPITPDGTPVKVYDYFLLTEEIMNRDHAPERYSNYYPCTDDRYIMPAG